MIRDTQRTIKLIAPAKVNLFLAVGAKDEDDYHPVANIMHTLVLHDTLYVTYKPSDKLSINIELLQSQDPDVEPPSVDIENNLVYKAFMDLASACKKPQKYDIQIFLEKNIPHQAGLGGGSSDAAAALMAAADIFNISLDDPVVLETAQRLGSDVPFFLHGSCALYLGHGDVLHHKIKPINRDIILVRPMHSPGLSTPKVYQELDNLGQVLDEDKFIKVGEGAEKLIIADNVPLFNNLAAASEHLLPELTKIREYLSNKFGADNMLLCGSGNASFAMLPQNYNEQEIANDIKKHGWWSTFTSLANTRARIMPSTVEV